MKNRKRVFRKPDAMPKLRRLPVVGELLCIQDLDNTVFPVIILSIDVKKTKKGNPTKLVEGITVFLDNKIIRVMLHDLRELK